MMCRKFFLTIILFFTLNGTTIGAEESSVIGAPVIGEMVEQSLALEAGDDASGTAIHYLLYVPKDFKKNDKTGGKKLPLMLFLHGLGECGDNELDLVKVHGPPKLISQGKHFPFIVVAPQCPLPDMSVDWRTIPLADFRGFWNPEQLKALVDHVSDQLNADPSRLYVSGLSMGGFGTWRFAAKYPDEVAAAIPICGGGATEWAKSLSTVPIWCFHGEKDPAVELKYGQEMIDAVKAAGGDPQFTVYPDVGHNSWSETYENEDVYEWMLEQRLQP